MDFSFSTGGGAGTSIFDGLITEVRRLEASFLSEISSTVQRHPTPRKERPQEAYVPLVHLEIQATQVGT